MQTGWKQELKENLRERMHQIDRFRDDFALG